MVFFTCNCCGSALKKNKVEKHYAVECRNPISVSCMDCLKDFYGFEYTSHNKCVTEEQKYSDKLADSKVQLGKGERKQMEWVETVRQIVETKGSTLTPQERQLLENLKDFENIPRKKKKFENFLKNAMGRYIDPRMIEKVWLLLEGHKAQAANDKEVASTVKEAESDHQDHTAGGKKKKGKDSKEVPEQVKASQEDEETHPVANLTTKKKKKHKSHAAQGDGSSEVVVGEGTESEKNEHLQGEEEHLAADTSKEVTTSISRETEEVADQGSQKEASPKLSKKERKEKKKKKKYELELETISKEKLVAESDKSLGVDDMDLDQGETQDEGKEKKSKKKGKKKRDTEKEEANTEGNIEATVVNGMKGAEKKKGKRKHSGNTEEESGDKKRMKDNAGEQEDKDSGVTSSDVNGVPTQDVKGKGKFKWDKTILSILKTVPDNELLVKRLRKKVLSEYQEALGEGKCQELSFEEALGMFERKLHKIPGVKVLKDKAKLVKSS